MSAHLALLDIHKANLNYQLTDPGNAGTLGSGKGIDRSPAFVNLISAGAETRTIPRPTAIGDYLTVSGQTVGGTITVTVTGGYNIAGDTTFLITAANQWYRFISVYNGTAFTWAMVDNYAAAGLSPTELAFLDGVVAGTAAASKALVLDSTGGISAFRYTGGNRYFKQAAPAAKTTTGVMTAAELLGGLLTANQGGGGAATYTTDTGTAIETAFAALVPGGVLANDDSFDFSIVNISTNAAEDVTVAGGASVTAVGNMTIASNAAVTDEAKGTFRMRRTAANTFSMYRIG
jgi:hypothetical protein